MKTWVTWALIAANVAMFGVELACGLDAIHPRAPDMIPLGANFAPYTLARHEWWRLVASMFLHYGLLHIAMNMICLALLHIVEKQYGHRGFAVIYLVSGLLGGVASLAATGYTVSAGASASIFGLFGALIVGLVAGDEIEDRAKWTRRAIRLGVFLLIDFVLGVQKTGIDVNAHVGGLVGGVLAGLAIRKAKPLPTFGIGLALTVFGLLALRSPWDADAEIEMFHQVEHKAVSSYNEKLKQQKANTIDRLAFAQAIEQEILPPWHDETAHLDALTDAQIPERLRPLFGILRKYAHDRELAWQELIKVQRDEAPDAHYHELEARVREDMARLGAEVKRLKTSSP